jgi:large subunit ribosomal protein L35
MPKMKTRKAAAKRLKRTGSGKLRRHKKGRRHLLSSKTTKRKRNLRRPVTLTAADMGRYDHLVP